MSVGVIAGSSSGISTTVKAELHHFPISTKAAAAAAARAGGGGLSLAPVKSVRFAPRRGCGSLRSAPSPPAFSSSSFRARATVEDGVVEEAAGAGRKSFYDLLGIPQGGSSAEIKRAYKEMARRYHPDVCPSPDRTDEYTRRFIEVQEAYETLSDPGRRARYDRDLARGLHLAFSARRRSHRCYHDEEPGEKSQWRSRWQDQLGELKRKSMSRDMGDNLSWGARMRRRTEESSTE